MVTVVWVNASHSTYCHVVSTVTWVRCHRDGSCWNSVRRILPWYGRDHGRRRINGTIVVCEKPSTEADASHSTSCCAVPTVTWVKCYRDRSCWNSVCHILLWYGREHGRRRINGTIAVCEKPSTEAEARARRWLRSRPGLRRGVDCARG